MNAPPRMSREEERRLNVRTLIFASIGSATAALVTSRLWIAGTWIAAAMTPVIVTLVSELLQRPTERIARGITTDRPALTPDEAAPEPGRAPEAAAAQRVAARLREDVTRPLPDPDAPVPGQPGGAGPTRVYRSGAAPARRRKIAFNVVFGTAALAFVIGALALTVPELIAGGSLAGNDRRTTLGGGKQNDSSNRDTQPPDRQAPAEEQEQQPPPTEEQPPPEEQPTTPETETETTPTPVPGEETVPPGEPLPPTDTTTTP